MLIRPDETLVVQKAALVIENTLVAGQPLKARVYDRWIFGLAIGNVVSYMKSDADGKRINGWAVTVDSWVPSKVRSTPSGHTQTPNNWPATPVAIFGQDVAMRDYKIQVQGRLKIWQVYEQDIDNDTDNSEIRSRLERGAVINSFSAAPRLGMEWASFEHDELKMPTIGLFPFGDKPLHLAQGNVPFSFEYVVKATT